MARAQFAEFDLTVGGTSIKSYITEVNGLSVEDLVEEITAAGDASAGFAAVGLTEMQPVTIGGPYNDAANGPKDELRANRGSTVAIVITIRSGTTISFSAIIRSFTFGPARRALTGYNCTLQPTGTITEA